MLAKSSPKLAEKTCLRGKERVFESVLPQTKMTLRHWMKRVTWLTSRGCHPLF